MNDVSERLFESGLLGTVLLDADDRVVARKGPLVDWVALEPASGCLPFLVGYEDVISDVRLGHRGLFTLPNVSLRFCPGHEEQICTVRAYPGPRPGHVALLFQDVGAVAELEQRVVQTSNELALAQRALAQAKEEAEAANRAKSNILNLVNHELRTPLNVIIGNAEILREEAIASFPKEELDGYLTDICENGRFLLEQINDLLDLAKIEAGRLELRETEVDIGSVMDEAIRTVRRQPYADGIAFRLAARVEPIAVWADRQRLKQIITNLLSNAAKAAPKTGTVTAACRWADGEGIVLEVADTGVGMAPGDVERALRPFTQVGAAGPESRHNGVGLGLPLAKLFTELHGGTLGIASEENVGTTVTVTLPPGRALRGRFSR
jgi:signal transduction histidine kinase